MGRIMHSQKQIEDLLDLSNYDKEVKFNNTVTFDDTINIGNNNDGIYFEEGTDYTITGADGLIVDCGVTLSDAWVNSSFNVGDLLIEKGTGDSGGANVDFQGTGTIILPPVVLAGSLPTSDPGVEGAIYIDNGVLKVSQG